MCLLGKSVWGNAKVCGDSRGEKMCWEKSVVLRKCIFVRGGCLEEICLWEIDYLKKVMIWWNVYEKSLHYFWKILFKGTCLRGRILEKTSEGIAYLKENLWNVYEKAYITWEKYYCFESVYLRSKLGKIQCFEGILVKIVWGKAWKN